MPMGELLRGLPRSADQSEPGPVEGIRCPGIAQCGSLCTDQRDGIARATSQGSIEAGHQLRGGAILHGPEGRQDLASASGEKRANQANPIITRRNVGEGAGAEAGLAGAQDHETSLESQAEDLVDLESAVVAGRGCQ